MAAHIFERITDLELELAARDFASSQRSRLAFSLSRCAVRRVAMPVLGAIPVSVGTLQRGDCVGTERRSISEAGSRLVNNFNHGPALNLRLSLGPRLDGPAKRRAGATVHASKRPCYHQRAARYAVAISVNSRRLSKSAGFSMRLNRGDASVRKKADINSAFTLLCGRIGSYSWSQQCVRHELCRRGGTHRPAHHAA